MSSVHEVARAMAQAIDAGKTWEQFVADQGLHPNPPAVLGGVRANMRDVYEGIAAGRRQPLSLKKKG